MSDTVIPFPDRKVRNVSWSELSTFRQCPHKHKLHYVDRWRKDEVSRPLATGILYHEALELYYTGVKAGDRAAGLEAALTHLKLSGASDSDHPNYEIASLVAWMFKGYLDFWVKQDTWKIIEVEMKLELPLTEDFKIHSRIDLLVEMNGHLWLVDHKSGKQLPTNKELDLDDQMPIYILGLRELGYPIRGAIYNNAITYQHKAPKPLADRFSRVWTYRTDVELAAVAEEAAHSFEMAYSDLNKGPRHPDPQNCKWRCQFVEACIGGRKADHLEESLLVANGFVRKEHREDLLRH